MLRRILVDVVTSVTGILITSVTLILALTGRLSVAQCDKGDKGILGMHTASTEVLSPMLGDCDETSGPRGPIQREGDHLGMAIAYDRYLIARTSKPDLYFVGPQLELLREFGVQPELAARTNYRPLEVGYKLRLRDYASGIALPEWWEVTRIERWYYPDCPLHCLRCRAVSMDHNVVFIRRIRTGDLSKSNEPWTAPAGLGRPMISEIVI